MLASGTTLGPYRIIAPLGAGGMGEVYRARDTRLGRDVAVKVIRAGLARDPERLKRFEQESRAAGALNHPNICTIHDVGTHDGAPFVVMELLEGESLRAKVNAGPIPLRKALDYVAQVARGLAVAHEKGIVHRDLKPENLFVTKDGRAKVLDFGLAKLTRPDVLLSAGDPAISVAATGSGSILGTAGYMAPEQVRGQAVDARSDLFALGAIIHELVSGQPPFKRGSFVESAHAILNEEVVPLSSLRTEVPPALDSLVRHCLEKEPGERFQSARDLAFAVEAVASSSPQSAPRPAANRWSRVVAVVAIVLLGFALGYLSHSRIGPPTRAPSFRRLTFHRGTIFGARFVPNDRSILYGASWEGNPVQVYSVIPGSPESRALTTDGATLLGVSRPGDMALELRPRRRNPAETSGTLARAPFAGGAPREILEDVIAADWSPDGAALAVVRRVAGKVRLEFPVGKVLYETMGWISNPRFSPRGDLIAFIDHPQGGDEAGSIATVDRVGRKTVLSGPWIAVIGLAWSARGDEVWFSAEQGAVARALYAVTLSRRQRLVLRQAGPLTLHDVAPDGRVLVSQDNMRVGLVGFDRAIGSERDLSWLDWSLAADISADGRSVLFTELSTGVGSRSTTYMRGTDGSPAVRLGEGWAVGLSADGTWALSIARDPAPALVLLPTGVGAPRTLARGPIEEILWASLFPDSRRVLMAGREKGLGPRLYVQDLEGGEPRRLGSGEVGGGHYWNPISTDGRRAVVPGPRGGFVVCSLGPDSATTLSVLESGYFAVRWTPDGRRLYVFSENGRSGSLEILDPVTGRRTPLRVVGSDDPAGLIHFGPMLVTPDGSAYAYNYFRILSDLYVVEGLK
jgi:serine/threonine protein kinase/Tol biopolymer transport system component